MPRRIVCRLLAAATVAFAVSALAVPSLVAAKVKAHAAATTIRVTAVDFKFHMSATKAKPGKVTFKITNRGHTIHDFHIDKKTSKMISPGQSTTLTVTLKKGKYPYECTIPGHAALGMKGTFTVT